MSQTKKPRTSHDTLLDCYKNLVLQRFKEDIKMTVEEANPASREDLRLAFNRRNGCDISPSVFAETLDEIGVTFERKLSVTIN